MPIKKGKPNFHAVLKRRRRTVADYLNELGITQIDELKMLLDSMQEQYIVTEQFAEEAHAHVARLEAARKANKPPKAPEPKVEKVAEDKKEEPEEKPKRRPRRTAKTSTRKKSTTKKTEEKPSE